MNAYNHVSGTVHPSVFDTDLIRLELSNNGMTGSLPGNLSAMSRLQILRITNNSFTGSLPEDYPSALVEMAVGSNNFSGPIPDRWSDLVSLQYLDASVNQFSGPVPSTLASLPILSYLDLSSNGLSSIDAYADALLLRDQTGYPSQLVHVNFSGNDLVSLPPHLASAGVLVGALSQIFATAQLFAFENNQIAEFPLWATTYLKIPDLDIEIGSNPYVCPEGDHGCVPSPFFKKKI